jgi:drug/metabolite transporter (DMT)-like permease
MNSRNKVLFAIMVFVWSLNWSVMKVGLENAPPFTFNYHRFLLSFVFGVALLFLFKSKVPRDSKTLLALLIYGLLTSVGFTFTAVGLVSVSSGIGAVLTYTQPLWILILAVFFLNEKLSLLKVFGTILGFLGLLILFLEELGSIMSFPALILVAGAALWSMGIVYYKVKLQNVDAVVASLSYTSLSTLISFVMGIFFEPPFTSWSPNYIATIAYCGILSTGIGMTIWVFLVKREITTSLSSSSMIVPMIALFFGWILLGEELGIQSLIGSALIIFSTYLVNMKGKHKK